MQTPTSPVREVARIAVPVSTEAVVLLLLNFVNQVIVGALGAVAIAAVGFANSLNFVVLITVSALGISVTILVARAAGAGRKHEMATTISSAVIVGAVVSGVFALALAVSPQRLLELVGASTNVASEGANYLRFIAMSLIPLVVSAILSGVLRATGRARVPMVITFITAGFGAALAWALVFGPGPFPALGVPGAGIATLISALLKLALLIPFVFRDTIAWATPSRNELRGVLGPLFILAIPMGLTEFAWASGTFLYNVVYQRLGDDALAAAQITVNLEGIFIVGAIGVMTAATALIGKAVGQADVDAVYSWIALLRRIGLFTGLAFGALFALTALLVPVFFPNAGADVQRMAVIGILINAAVQAVKVGNMIYGVGILPSGNDVKGVLIGTAGSAFLIGLPLAVFLGLFTPLGIIGIFLARVVEEIVKFQFFRLRARRLDWSALIAQQAARAA